ncbi:hypothetical protein [Nocardioides cynanchi]|uniref:hypothetical protein n=1 Tax=Nocardioides cynanchi TaxID=2558918 RepID=UPI0012478E79|nr:hypothetical protein [Nocardioides cynanchi]
MTDHQLRDLLHESVADAAMPDVADRAWEAGGRRRRRRAASAVGGVVSVVLVVGGLAWAVDHREGNRSAAPTQSTKPTRSTKPTQSGAPYTGRNQPDGSYRGTSVWWAPSVGQESSLPYTATPLPTTIDLASPDSGLVGDPVSRALAAFAVTRADGSLYSIRVLGADGLLRGVDLGTAPDGPAQVQPMRDPEGNLRIRAGESMLSPSGEYLMFPQDGSIRVFRLKGQQWSTIDTGSHSTWDATWTPDDDIVLWDPARPDAHPPVYDVRGRPVTRAGATDDLNPRWDSDPYGLPRRSASGSLAQSYTSGADVPQPPSLGLSPGQSDWIGIASAPDAILVLPQEAARQKQCCEAAGWLDRDVLLYESRSSEGFRLLAWQQGTGNFWQVSDVVGWRPGYQSVVASYARLPVVGTRAVS